MTQLRQRIIHPVVTTTLMTQIEERLFQAGMPVPALMEKVAGLVARRVETLYPDRPPTLVLVGPGHNGGDALVVARELHLKGYPVQLYRPFTSLKDLTATHVRYAQSLGIPTLANVTDWEEWELGIDGLFGFGLTRPIVGEVAQAIASLNHTAKPILSIDLPSGIETDTGAILGIAIRATHTFCLGLWKQAFWQESAIPYLGQIELIDFGIPQADIEAVLTPNPPVQLVSKTKVIKSLPLPRSPITHKYQQGHLLLVCGSRRYAGAAILAGLGARGSGVGMVSIAVPHSLKSILTNHLPEALILECPETETGAISHLDFPLKSFTAIACGPGLTPEAIPVIQQIIPSNIPLIIDADGLNILGQLGTVTTLKQRPNLTILTPHLGEFKRLFPDIEPSDRILASQQAAKNSGAIVLLKGARTAIASPSQQVRLIPQSTPALARGGSGDILTGLMGGFLAQNRDQEYQEQDYLEIVAASAWCHAQAGILASEERTELGVDPLTLAEYLVRAISSLLPI